MERLFRPQALALDPEERGPRRILGRVLLVVGSCLAPGCGPRLTEDWDETLEMVTEAFPSVPQVSTGKLEAELGKPPGSRPVLFDVRAPEEYAVSHLPGAHSIPDLEAAEAWLEAHGGDPAIVVYCSVGYRSSELAQGLADRGVTDVRNLEGSIFLWANEGRPLHRGSKRTVEVHPFDRDWGKLLQREHWPPDWLEYDPK